MIAPLQLTLDQRLVLHPSISCGTCGTEIFPELGKLDQSGPPLDAAVYACGSGNCEWKRTVRLLMPDASSIAVEVQI